MIFIFNNNNNYLYLFFKIQLNFIKKYYIYFKNIKNVFFKVAFKSSLYLINY